jgi:hypothetical protein
MNPAIKFWLLILAIPVLLFILWITLIDAFAGMPAWAMACMALYLLTEK